jgi:DUF1680 family protein
MHPSPGSLPGRRETDRTFLEDTMCECDNANKQDMTRRRMLGTMGKAAVAVVALSPLSDGTLGVGAAQEGAEPLHALAGPDRVVIRPGKTYINSWAGYGVPPWKRRRRWPGQPEEAEPTGPEPTVAWSKESGPGGVTFENPKAFATTAAFSAPGTYVLKMVADNGLEQSVSKFTVTVRENDTPSDHIQAVLTKGYKIKDPIWGRQVRNLMVNWIPHCIDQINRSDLELGPGGIDNFIEAGKAQRGEPHGDHKGFVFSNAWVHQTVESMSVALMIDPQNDAEVMAAQDKMRKTLEQWIPIILAAREPDGYLQTAYTLRDRTQWRERWTPEGRSNHEGYTQGYFIESGIAHHVMTGGKDTRLYDAAKKCADTWCDHIGRPPKQEWFDGHQEMEQALVRFGHYVNSVEGANRGRKYIELAKFLLDCRHGGSDYDQSRLPVTQEYEAVGHAVRAAYTYSGMGDVALSTHDVDYLSAVNSIWDSVVNKKYYLTGGIGSGETSEGFGDEYSLPNRSYCESCSSCGEMRFQVKMNRLYKDAKYADLIEETLYNGLLGSTDLEARHFYYDNPLESNVPRYEWHICPCCVGNIPRTLLMLPTWMYGTADDGLYVNLFVGGTVNVENVAGTDVEITQENGYPWRGNVAITVNPKASKAFAIRVRVPNRAVSTLYRPEPDANGVRSLKVNGREVALKIENGYVVLDRTWKKGDRIDLELPLAVQRVKADERVEADRGRVALKYGPLVYNIEKQDQDIDKVLDPDAPLSTEWRENFLGGVMVIKGLFTDGSPMLAIPNYARYNRVEGTYAPMRPERPADGGPPKPFPPTSIIWIKDA